LPERDATVSALLLAELMAWHGKSLGELLSALHREFGEFHYGRVDLPVKPAQKQKAIEHFRDEKHKRLEEWPVSRREGLDGSKIYLGKVGWVLVRASGTENLLRIYAETTAAATTQTVLAATVRTIQGL
jgi:phosphomannomutase